jgi:hypothetical protein
VLSCDVIIWDDNTPFFYFSWKLHSLQFPARVLSQGKSCMALGSGNGLKIRKNFELGTGAQCAVLVLICYTLGEKTLKNQESRPCMEE